MKVIIASNNKGKIKEFKEILSPLGYEVVSQGEAGIKIEVEETGSTFSENAYLKAKAIFDITDNCCVLADDSGLMVDLLNGEPGVYSARYGGLETDVQRSALILQKLGDAEERNRTARFICSICFIKADGEKVAVEGKCEGIIGTKPLGENGFGYDPIFMYGDKSFAQVSAEEKNKVSHRADAIRKLIEKLK
ncbi:MAG: RdgB/HAM1 family non-canonical purine NTP pyrophosphatase [Ruminococcus sp.]|nr:RdgB/HAM1 family non-canonical purine NTP pyrophosphatase [Ruminococcus sp.]